MSRLVAAARAYLTAGPNGGAVKWRHRGRTAVGLDCAGLPWIAYKDCGVALPDFRLYGPEPHNDGLVTHITEALGEPVNVAPVWQSGLMVGDVIVIRLEIEPHHVGIVTDYPYGNAFGIIHADGHYGKVIEHRLSNDYTRRITHVYRRPV